MCLQVTASAWDVPPLFLLIESAESILLQDVVSTNDPPIQWILKFLTLPSYRSGPIETCDIMWLSENQRIWIFWPQEEIIGSILSYGFSGVLNIHNISCII